MAHEHAHSHSHDHAHDHSHDHHHHHHHDHDHHHHHHQPNHFGRAFAIGISLNFAFVAIEAWFGWRSGSLALLADAAHNLSDVGSLILAWVAIAAGKIVPTHKKTYGWQRASILASFSNAVILLVAMGSLAWEAAQRLHTPQQVGGMTVIIVAAIGIVINGITAWLFMAGSKHDLNIRGAFLHMVADTLVSLGVVLAGCVYLWKGWGWIDPVVSLAIAAIIVLGTWSLFRQSLHLLFDGVPEHIHLAEVKNDLQKITGVISVHDLHVWAMATSDVALTAHLVLDGQTENTDTVLQQASKLLLDKYDIHHTTLQCESQTYAEHCKFCEVKS